MSQISNLSPKQVARLSEYADKWKNIGLSTEPAERAMAEDGIRMAYRLAGLPEPKKIIWCSSPMAGAITKAILTDTGASVRASVWNSVWDSVMASVMASVGASVGDSVWNSLRDSAKNAVWDACYGQHDAPWLGFYEYFRDVCNQAHKNSTVWSITIPVGLRRKTGLRRRLGAAIQDRIS